MRERQTEFSPALRQSVYQMGTIGYDIQVVGNQRYRDLIKDHRKAIINSTRYIDFGRSDALGQCNVLIRQLWREKRRYYACAYLRRKLFARGGKRINVAVQLLRSAFCSERVRCFSNNDIASPRVVQQRKLLSWQTLNETLTSLNSQLLLDLLSWTFLAWSRAMFIWPSRLVILIVCLCPIKILDILVVAEFMV